MKIRNIVSVMVLLLSTACTGISPAGTPSLDANTPSPTGDSPVVAPLPADATPSAQPIIPDTASTLDAAPIDCLAPVEPTPSLTEGPYYTPGSPENSSLAGNLAGTRLLLTGYVVDTSCNPIQGAWLDFWQADSSGNYDNSGYTLRGHQYTDENGQFQLETVVPGLYPGRTEHIHVKVQAPGGPVVTTQLFFPDVSQNNSDGIFDPSLIIQIIETTSEEIRADFTFIIPPA